MFYSVNEKYAIKILIKAMLGMLGDGENIQGVQKKYPMCE